MATGAGHAGDAVAGGEEHEPLRRRNGKPAAGTQNRRARTHRAERHSPRAASTASATGVLGRLRGNLPSVSVGADGASVSVSSIKAAGETASDSDSGFNLRSLPRVARVAAAVAAAWLGTGVAHLLHADLVVLGAIVVGTAALSRYGSTLLDRLMAALVLLAGGGIVGGLVISYWPWGLDPVAVGGSGLTAVVGVRVLSGRRFRLPGRVPGVDVVAVAGGAAALLVAAWPTLHTEYWKRFMYSALLADRVRQFAMFDVVRSGHSYAFAHFDRVSASALPGARSYPSGMQMVYSIVDCFVHGDGAPRAPIDEFDRY